MHWSGFKGDVCSPGKGHERGISVKDMQADVMTRNR